ncbi:MAG TPA: carboxypeptidase-like regulatory domain-containing protein [Sphingobacterium sp.]|nr:carboxypeptidase-like regulatory domain-containing protein [Sphingobacterium sp.]
MFGKRSNYPVLILLVMSSFLTYVPVSTAQQRLQGIVYELESSSPIWNVAVKNLRTKEETTSDREGKFTISAQLNDYLTFTIPGYQTDTAFIYEEGVRRVYMLRDESAIAIDEVVVTRLTDSRLEIEIRKAKNEGKAVDVSQQQGGLRVSPSRLFGKKAKNARSNLALLIEEQNNRKVDKKFTARLIASIVPLNEEEIALFRTRFRPTVEFIETASPEDIRIYILDAYKKFRVDE